MVVSLLSVTCVLQVSDNGMAPMYYVPWILHTCYYTLRIFALHIKLEVTHDHGYSPIRGREEKKHAPALMFF